MNIDNLMTAIDQGDVDTMKRLINTKNVNDVVEFFPFFRSRVLSESVHWGYFHVVNWLLSIGANPRLVCTAQLPIHCISHRTTPGIIKIVYDAYPIALCVKNDSRRIPLHIAVMDGCSTDCCRLLLELGSPVNEIDAYSQTSFTLSFNRRDGLWKLLIDYGTIVTEKCYLLISLIGMSHVKENNVRAFVKRRQDTKNLALVYLTLKRRRALLLGGGNGRDMLRLVSQHIWNSRMPEITP